MQSETSGVRLLKCTQLKVEPRGYKVLNTGIRRLPSVGSLVVVERYSASREMAEVIDDPLSDLVRRESNTTEVTSSVESSCKDNRIDQFGTTHIADKVMSSVLLGVEDWPRKDLVKAWRRVVINCGIGRRFGVNRWIVDGNWIETLEL